MSPGSSVNKLYQFNSAKWMEEGDVVLCLKVCDWQCVLQVVVVVVVVYYHLVLAVITIKFNIFHL